MPTEAEREAAEAERDRKIEAAWRAVEAAWEEYERTIGTELKRVLEIAEKEYMRELQALDGIWRVE